MSIPRPPSPSADSSLRRIGYVPAFDGLRGILAFIVVSSHGIVLAPDWSPLPRELAFYPPGGFLALDVFFVMSGFLITALLLGEQGRNGRIGVLGFYRRRALRLLPVLFCVLALHVAYAHATGIGEAAGANKLVPVLAYYGNLARAWGEDLGPFNHTWSLAVEEQFYIVWPCVVILFLGVRRRLATVTFVLVAAIGAIAVHRALLWQQGHDWLDLYVRTDTRADAILVGALLAHLWVRGRTPQRDLGLVGCAGLAILLTSMLAEPTPARAWYYLGGFTVASCGSALLLLAVIDGPWSRSRILRFRPFVALGDVSYGIYVWHFPIFFAVARYGAEWSPQLRIAVALPLTAVAVYLGWVLVERPALRFKDRLEKGRSSKPVDRGGPARREDPSRSGSAPDRADVPGPRVAVGPEPSAPA